MSIKINNKDIVAIYKSEQSIAYVYKGIDLVWQLNADPLDKSIYFADPEVGRVLHANGLIANPIKSSKRELATITTLNPNPDPWDGRTTSYFYNNKVITKFPELQYCTGLSDLRHTFYDCSNLREATIPDSVTNMTCTFDGCSSFVIPPVIPESVNTMWATFRGCSKLAEAPIIPEGVTEMRYTFYGCSNLREAPIIPEGVTDMFGTFRGCSKLRKAPILPSSVSQLGDTFRNCSSLVEAPIIPEGVVSMNGTFYNCTSLVSSTPIIIPESVIEMTECFRYCSSLDGIFILKPITPPTYYYTFEFTHVVAVYVPDESIRSYTITSEWVGVSARTYPMSECPFEVCGIFTDPEVGRVLHANGLIESPTHSTPEELATIKTLNPRNTSTCSYFYNNKVITQFPELQYCTGLTSLRYAFEGCSSLTKVVLPSSVTDLYHTFSGCSSLTKAPIIPERVTNMEDTFNGCTSLATAPVIPSSVYNLSNTFYGCSSLTTVVIPEGVIYMGSTFWGCSSITTAPIIPSSVINLSNTFYGCTSIDGIYIINAVTPPSYSNGLYDVQAIHVPDESVDTYKTSDGWSEFADKIYPMSEGPFQVSGKFADPEVGRVLKLKGLIADANKSSIEELATITSLNPKDTSSGSYFYDNKVITQFPELQYCTGLTDLRNAFNGCSNLTKVVLPSNVTELYNTFRDCSNLTKAPVIPSSVTDLSYAFYNCSNLTKVVLPSNVTDLYYTFYGCTSITTAPDIPSSVTNLGGTFRGCSSITTAPTIPEGVTNLSSAFQGCTSITTAPVIPSSVTNLSDTFNGCSSLTKAPIIPSSVKYMYATFRDCSSLATAPDIPSSVTDLRYAFFGCSSLTTAPDIPEGVTSLSGTFDSCKFTTAPNIPEGVTRLNETFQHCTNLTTAPDIPSSVTDLRNTFNECSSIDGIYIINIVTPVTYDNSLSRVQAIYVPDASVSAYKRASGWSSHASKIYPMSTKP